MRSRWFFALTLWPVVYMALFLAWMVATLLGGDEALFVPFLIAHMITFVLTIVLAVLYVRDVFHNPDLASDYRIMWTVILLLGGPIANPIYWWIYLRRRPERPGAGAPAGLQNQ